MTTRSRRRWRTGLGLAVMATLALLIGRAIVASRDAARQGSVRFRTDGPMVAARIEEASSGRVVIPTLAAPTVAPIALPEGTYRIEATRPDSLSSAALFDVARGQTNTYRLDLKADRMGHAVPIGPRDRYGFVDVGPRRDLLVLREEGAGVARHDLVGDRQLWDVRWEEQPTRQAADAAPLAEARRLDADDEPDVVFGNADVLIAASGRTGAVLWQIRPDDEAATLVGPARWIEDIDGDGADDLAWLIRRDAFGWIEARSGRDGHRLWRADLPATPALVPLEIVALADRAALIAAASSRLVALDPMTGQPLFDPVDLTEAPTSAPIALDRDGDGHADHLSVCGRETCSLIDLRPGAGRRAWTASSSHVWPPRWLDDDRLVQVGVATNDVLTLTVTSIRTDRIAWTAQVPTDRTVSGPRPDDLALIDANSDGDLDVIVSRRIDPPPPPPATRAVAPPDSDPRPIQGDRATLDALDGTNGNVLWSVPMRTTPHRSSRTAGPMIVGPDLDGDGVAELFVASFGLRTPEAKGPEDARHSLFVDAISGADGTGLWWWRRELVAFNQARLDPLRWWSRGPGHLPALVVRHDTTDSDMPDRDPTQIWVLRAEDGELLASSSGDSEILLDDLDEDGIDELVTVPSRHLGVGSVAATRGRPPAAWRRLGRWQATPDLDGDGIDDLIAEEGPNFLPSWRAVSSIDGRSLWRVPRPGLTPPPPTRAGDFDGDGIADFLGNLAPPWAISGRTGGVPGGGNLAASMRKRLLDDFQPGAFATPAQPGPWTADLDGDGIAEIVFVFPRFRRPRPADPTRGYFAALDATALAAVDGRTGALRWESALETGSGDVEPFARVRTAELDGTPGLDFATLSIDATMPMRYRVRALRGRDGQELWSRHASRAVQPGHSDDWAPVLATTDLDGDGVAEVLLADRVEDPNETKPVDPNAPEARLVPLGPSRLVVQALGGRDGAERWVWEGEPAFPAVVVNPQHHRWAMRLLITRRAGADPTLWLDLIEWNQRTEGRSTRERFLLDARGRLIDSRKHEAPASAPSPNGAEELLGTWAVGDPDGDGNDALAWHDPETDQLHVHLESRLDPSWHKSPFAKSLGVASLALLRRQGRAAVAAVQGVFATAGGPEATFDLATGAPLPPPEPGRVTLAGGRSGDPARQLVVAANMSWVEASGDVPISWRDPGPDPRLATPFPWADRPRNLYLLGSVPFALVLLALPTWALMGAARARSLRWALLGIAAVAVAVAASRQGWLSNRVEPDQLDTHHQAARAVGALYAPIFRSTHVLLDPRWVRALVGLPLVAAAVACWSWRRRSGRLLLAFALATVAAAAAWLIADRWWREPHEYYESRGWPWIGLWGASALGLGGMIESTLRGASSLRRGRRKATKQGREEAKQEEGK